MTRAFLYGDNGVYNDILEQLKDAGIEMTVYVTQHPQNKNISPLLSNARRIELRQLENYNDVINLNNSTKEVVSEEILEQFREAESVFMSISDKKSFYQLPVNKKKRAYVELLIFWFRIIREEKIELLLFGAAPHGVNNILFHVAKYLGVHTLFMERTLITNRILLLKDYRLLDRVPDEFMTNATLEEVKDGIDPEILNDYEQGSIFLDRAKRRNQQSATILRELMNNWRLMAVKDISKGLFKRTKKKHEDPQTDNTGLLVNITNKLNWINSKWTYHQYIYHLRKSYDKVATSEITTSPYAIMFLNVQPERTSLPCGGYYENQILAVKTLVSALPEGWTLYVKEHPRQFIRGEISMRFRYPEYYDELISIPNVQLLSLSINNADLIKNSRFTSTVGGSVGWEGLEYGKPCILFGNPWYSGCGACFVVKSTEECRQAIEQINNMTPVNVLLHKFRFIAYYQDKLFRCANKRGFAKKSNLDYELLKSNLVKGIVGTLGST